MFDLTQSSCSWLFLATIVKWAALSCSFLAVIAQEKNWDVPDLNCENVCEKSGSSVATIFLGMHVFWTWAPFFWTCTCFLDLTGFFWDLGSQKMWGTSLCVFWTLWGYFFGPACICAGPREFFSTAKLIVSELGFCFLDPCTCFVDLASIGWGGNSIVIGAHIGLDVFGPWRLLFWNPHTFFWTWHRVGGI